MRRFIHIGALVCSVLAATAHACLWDRDTLAAEARGLPGITEVITGRFDRFPPLFYEMRLERVTGEIDTDPDNLDLYDDAGVACDRLGRSDEAIAWMGRKLVLIERLESEGVAVSEHRYRYLANLGTFYNHRWLMGRQDREDMGDVDRARDLIAAAIELNPDAHFGRERYQLLAIEWILNQDVLLNGRADSIFSQVPELQDKYGPSYGKNRLASAGYSDAVEGLSGLIEFGNAWQSVDIYHSLAWALADRGDHVVGHLSMLRVKELVAQGNQSISVNFNASISFDYLDYGPGSSHVLKEYADLLSEEFYPEARIEADAWVAHRNAYLLERLQVGRHPDTNPNFWDQWHEQSSPPKYPSGPLMARHPFLVGFMWICGLPVGVVLVLILLYSKRHLILSNGSIAQD